VSDGPITTVVVDFGGVLTTPLASAFGVVREHLDLPPEALGRAMAAVAAERGAHPLHELELGELPEAQFFALLGERLTAQLGRDVILQEFAERYWAALAPNAELIEHLRAVRRAGYRMGLLTNNVREWEPQWRGMIPRLDEIFEFVIDSAYVGMRKPDPGIYMLTVDRFGGGVAPTDCVFIDDIDVNCTAAAELGMTAVHFTDTTKAIAEVEAAL